MFECQAVYVEEHFFRFEIFKKLKVPILVQEFKFYLKWVCFKCLS